MGISVIPDYSFAGININIVLYFFILLLNMSVLRFGVRVDLGAKRIGEKVKQEPNGRGPLLEGPSERHARDVGSLLCLTQAFGPSRGPVFTLKDLYWSQLYLIHNVWAWRGCKSLSPEAALRNNEKPCETVYCSDMISSFEFNQVYSRRTPQNLYLQNLRAWGRDGERDKGKKG